MGKRGSTHPGVREFLSKPIDQERLLGAVEKAINEGGRRDKFAT